MATARIPACWAWCCQGDEDDWLITVNFEKTGYIKDDDARNWNVGELLDSLREGTKQSNVERVKRGFPSC